MEMGAQMEVRSQVKVSGVAVAQVATSVHRMHDASCRMHHAMLHTLCTAQANRLMEPPAALYLVCGNQASIATLP